MLNFLVIFLCLSTLKASVIQEITEAELLNLSKNRAPNLELIKASMLGVETQQNILEEDYAPEIFGKASYAETQERPIIEFLPVFTPVKQIQLGLRQKLSNGFQADLLATTDQRSASSSVSGKYDNVTTTILSFTLQMDLWRDLFGRVSKSERQNAELDTKRAKLEQDIKSRAFEITLRKIYWSMVANQEQLKVAENLKVTAGQQVNDAKKRLQGAIGDIGEVARYEAQVAQRTSQVIFLNYQRETLIKQLKSLLPDLGTSDVRLGAYDLSKTFDEVVACSALIIQHSLVPYDYTKYDEVINLLREVKSNQRKIYQRYSDLDVKLYGTVKSTGIGSDKLGTANYEGSYGESFDDMTSNNRGGYEAGIRMNYPLGDAKKNTRDSKSLFEEKRLQATMDQTDAQVISTHTQIAKSMKLISEVVASQKMGTRALEQRLKVIRKKYSQARVSVNDLILDQDALLASEINTIEAQLQALNVLFDYLMIFTDTPCAFNRI